MEKEISPKLTEQQIRELVKSVKSGDTLNTASTEQFELIKKLLVEYKLVGLRLCLLDEDGYILRQVSSRSRNETVEATLSPRQHKVLKALERVLDACDKENIALIGYSDSLVAMPRQLVNTDLASAEAREVDDSGVYIGADLLKP